MSDISSFLDSPELNAFFNSSLNYKSNSQIVDCMSHNQ